MFNQSVESRLSEWKNHRNLLEVSPNPLQDVWDFWNKSPFIPYNRNIDHYYQDSWPSPWEIIAENKYDDFTKALMIGLTLKLTNKFANSKIELKTIIDNINQREYNLIYVNEDQVINYDDNGPIPASKITGSFIIENLVELNPVR